MKAAQSIETRDGGVQVAWELHRICPVNWKVDKTDVFETGQYQLEQALGNRFGEQTAGEV